MIMVHMEVQCLEMWGKVKIQKLQNDTILKVTVLFFRGDEWVSQRFLLFSCTLTSTLTWNQTHLCTSKHITNKHAWVRVRVSLNVKFKLLLNLTFMVDQLITKDITPDKRIMFFIDPSWPFLLVLQLFNSDLIQHFWILLFSWWHDHNKHGIILKRIKWSFEWYQICIV